MEGEQSTTILIGLGTLGVLFLVVLVILFVIRHKRNLYAKQGIIDILENKCLKEIQKLKKEVKELKTELKDLKEQQDNSHGC